MPLERLDLAAEQIVVFLDVLALAQPIQQRRVFARRDADAVARRVNDLVRLDRGVGEDRGVRQATCADSRAKRTDESATA